MTRKITRAVARVKLGFQTSSIWATWMRGATRGPRARLGWRPRVGFEALVAERIEADLPEAERDHLVK